MKTSYKSQKYKSQIKQAIKFTNYLQEKNKL